MLISGRKQREMVWGSCGRKAGGLLFLGHLDDAKASKWRAPRGTKEKPKQIGFQAKPKWPKMGGSRDEEKGPAGGSLTREGGPAKEIESGLGPRRRRQGSQQMMLGDARKKTNARQEPRSRGHGEETG